MCERVTFLVKCRGLSVAPERLGGPRTFSLNKGDAV
jgi:hypothetical protein